MSPATVRPRRARGGVSPRMIAVSGDDEHQERRIFFWRGARATRKTTRDDEDEDLSSSGHTRRRRRGRCRDALVSAPTDPTVSSRVSSGRR